MTACQLNVAQCALKRDEWFMAEKVCTEALERLVDPMGRDREQNLKALFRTRAARGRAGHRPLNPLPLLSPSSPSPPAPPMPHPSLTTSPPRCPPCLATPSIGTRVLAAPCVGARVCRSDGP